MEQELTIKVDHISKVFRLPHDKNTSIKGAVLNFYKGKRSYEEQVALKDISFEVKRGEFFGIVGRNGSGKSTLLKMLAGIYTPTKGTIQINGKLTPFIELGVGFNMELTGRENVFLNGALLGFSRKEMLKMYNDIVNFAELKRFMDQKLKNYSSGMQVRLAFSIAIRANPDILLLDEVLAVGDAAFQKKCYEYFMQLKKNKRTVVLVTHDMGAVRQYCDSAIMIENGVIVKKGKPDAIAQSYQKLFAAEAAAAKKVDDEHKQLKKEDEDRWGSGQLIVERSNVNVKDDHVTITTTYKSYDEIDAPILGFTVYDSAGTNIVEGNTQRSRKKTNPMLPKEKVTIEWQIPNVFKDGNYTVSLACCDQSTVNFYDWLNNANSFTIDRSNPTAGIIAPKLKILEHNLSKKHD